MPQLAVETFVSQYFWLLVILFLFYMLSILKVIPQISLIKKIRQNTYSSVEGTKEEGTEEVSFNINTQIIENSVENTNNTFKSTSTNWIAK